jgi:hypothetical protein
MKKILYILTTALLFAGCEPIIHEVGNTNIVDASQIEATVEKRTVDGFDNVVHVHCTSPVLCRWTDGISTFIGTEGDLKVMFEGNNTITLTARAANGQEYTKDFPVTITSTPEPPAYYAQLFGDPSIGEKYWEWNTTVNAPDAEDDKTGARIMAGKEPKEKRDYWGWIPSPDDDVPNEGIGAKMKFTLRGMGITKIGVDGAETGSGSLNLDMTPDNNIYKSVGTITFVGTNVLCPIGPQTKNEFKSTWTICHLDDDLLMLFNTDTDGWYYVFTAAQP